MKAEGGQGQSAGGEDGADGESASSVTSDSSRVASPESSSAGIACRERT